MTDIQAVIFDYGNVIAHVDNALFLRKLEERSPLSFSEIEQRIYPDISRAFESGRLSSSGFYDAVISSCSVDMSEDEFRSAFTTIFERIPSTIALIKSLKQQYKVALLSNTNPMDFAAEIETVEVFPLFDSVTLSFEVGSMKPGPEIYRDALQRLRAPANACVYIDDIREYAEAATSLGMHGIHYTNPQELSASLASLGISSTV